MEVSNLCLICVLNPITANSLLYKLTVQKKAGEARAESYLLLGLILSHFMIHLPWPRLFTWLCYTPVALAVGKGKIKISSL